MPTPFLPTRTRTDSGSHRPPPAKSIPKRSPFCTKIARRPIETTNRIAAVVRMSRVSSIGIGNLSGTTSVDESMLTGESLPVLKHADALRENDEVRKLYLGEV